MRGIEEKPTQLFSYVVDLERRIPLDHRLRAICVPIVMKAIAASGKHSEPWSAINKRAAIAVEIQDQRDACPLPDNATRRASRHQRW
jgi:hypothetical protein